MSFWICATCAVEHAERMDVCAICADERQWVPADGQHWTTQFDGSRCITDVTVVDATAMRGSATCKGVQWYDALDMAFTRGEPKKIDEPKFDAEITFEALP